MTIRPVADELFAQFMDQVSGAKFENFAKLVMAAEYGDMFLPLGGVHDGGADGLLSATLYEGKKPNTFHQFAATGGERAKSKISRTIEALRKAGRTPTSLIYATSEEVPKQDVIQQEIFEEAGILVTIRDRERIKSVLNKNLEANRAFYSTFAGEIISLSQARADITGAVNEFVQDPTVFVFLNHELRDRSSKDKMLNRVADALIYWSLRETDPDSTPKKLMTYAEISEKIVDVFPTATAQLLPRLNDRLIDLRKKPPSGQERLRHYGAKNSDSYCLPFDMRKELELAPRFRTVT